MPVHCRMRGFDRDLIRGGHYGQRSCEPHLAEHMAAPTNAANVKKALANSEPSTHGTFGLATRFGSAPISRMGKSGRWSQHHSFASRRESNFDRLYVRSSTDEMPSYDSHGQRGHLRSFWLAPHPGRRVQAHHLWASWEIGQSSSSAGRSARTCALVISKCIREHFRRP